MAHRQRQGDRSHASYRRTKHGCLTCRRRKKKCDEVKPQCAGCRRNDLQCCWATEEESQLETNPTGRTEDGVEQAGTLSSGLPKHGAHLLREERSPQTSHCIPNRSRSRHESLFPPEEAPSKASIAEQNAFHSFNMDDLELQVTDDTGVTLQAKDDTELAWQSSVQCYLASTRPVHLTPHSTLFLQHYITTTGAMLPMPLTNNAFLNVMLPLACKGDILMHSLLALGGAHMLCDRDRTLPGLQQVRDSMLKHYIWTIHQVRKELASFDDQDYVRTVRLVFVLTLLCHVEV